MIKEALSWAGSMMLPGAAQSTAESPRFPRKPRLSFDELYPRISDPLKLNAHQRSDLLPRLGFTSVSTNEVDLALSRTPADTEPSNVASVASGVDDNDPPDEPYIFGEMNREPDLAMLVKDHPDLNDHTPELSLIALAAYNNGAHLVILTKDKVYMASTDQLDYLDEEVHRAGY